MDGTNGSWDRSKREGDRWEVCGHALRFPKGTKGSNPLRLDGAIFDSPEWIDRYTAYWRDRHGDDLEWLNDHLLAIIEFKRGERNIDQVFTTQVKPAMKEKDPGDAYVLGVYYDAGRLLLFHRRGGKYIRYDDGKNQKGDNSGVGDLSLHLPDPYVYIPSFEELRTLVNRPSLIDRSNRGVKDLDTITSIASVQVHDALSEVLRTLDRVGLVNQRGYEILVQAFSLKIFDEKRNKHYPDRPLEFYVTDDERSFENLRTPSIQKFISRMEGIRTAALGQYEKILQRNAIDWRDVESVRAVVAVCENFQDFSFVESSKSDLYQLVFYNFANRFQQHEKAQFLTPLPIINFLVDIVHPCDGETVCDPCCGIADFLSLSFVHAQSEGKPFDDANIYGLDVSTEMITLGSLNMLLNGDGKAHLFRVPDKGSIFWKVEDTNPPRPVELIPERHKAGKWDDWPDLTRLMKFDIILTNPPFGKDRAYRAATPFDRRVIEMYETWPLAGGGDWIDLGIVFLENAYHSLRENGRLGIVLSDSIASNNRYQQAREWFMERMRIVALFDLPANVFAETGVITTLIVAYKPEPAELRRLQAQGYSIFARQIHNVGYEKRTVKRNVIFDPMYRIDEATFDVVMDDDGAPVLDEDFSQALVDFRQWTLAQEATLQRLFRVEV